MKTEFYASHAIAFAITLFFAILIGAMGTVTLEFVVQMYIVTAGVCSIIVLIKHGLEYFGETIAKWLDKKD